MKTTFQVWQECQHGIFGKDLRIAINGGRCHVETHMQ